MQMQKSAQAIGRRSSSRKIRRIISFDSETYSELKELAEKDDRPFSWEVRRAIGQYLGKNPPGEGTEKIRRKLLDEGISKEIAALIGILPHISLKEEKSAISEAIGGWIEGTG